MINLDVKFDLERFRQGQTKIENKLKKVLMKSMFKMEELAIDGAPFDRGGLREKISLFPQILAHRYILESRAPYSAVMEYGSRPFYAPIEPLKDWARRKLGDESAAYAVRAKIAKEGITASPFMRPAFYSVRDYYLRQYMKEIFN